MKQEVEKWRSTLDTQVKTYKVDIFELKKELNSELNQLRTEFKELKTNLQVRQDSLTSGRRNLEVQKWRSTLDTQVKTYKVDIFELKKELNSELNQLRTTNLQVRQDSLTSGRRNLIKNDSEHAQESESNSEGKHA